MKCHQNREPWCGGRAVGSGFDATVSESCDANGTRSGGVPPSEPAAGEQSPAVVGFPVRSNRRALVRTLPLWSVLGVERRQPGVGHHREGDVAMPTGPEAHLVLVEPSFALRLLDALLDGVARRGNPRQVVQRGV